MAVEALILRGAGGTEVRLREAPDSATGQRSRVALGEVLVDQVGLPEAVALLDAFLNSGRPHQVVTVNMDFVRLAERIPQFRATLNAADLAVADGMPLVWLSRLKGHPLAQRVTGVDLVNESCRLAANRGRSVFLLGAAPGVAELAARRLQESFPGLTIAGTYSPSIGPLKRKEHEQIVRIIRKAKPDFLFVALGAPRQDLWIRDNMDRLQVPIAMGVGCVFDLLAGSIRRAPVWMQRAGLEWAFRLGQEPTRLWRRYLVDDLPTLAKLLLSDARDPAQDLTPPRDDVSDPLVACT